MSLYYLMNHCRWLPGSAFSTTKPIDVNKKLIKNFHLPPKVFCVYLNQKKDCYVYTLATIYPGQTITVMLSVNKTVLGTENLQTSHFWTTATNNIDSEKEEGIVITAEINYDTVPPTSCRLLSEATQKVYNHCVPVNYTIVHSTFSHLKWCELFIK